MTISVRLDDDTRRLLTRLARSHRLSQSEVVRRAIRRLANSDSSEDINVYERIKHLIGIGHSGRSDLSQQTGENFRQMLLKKWKQRDNDSRRRRPSRRSDRR
jgi:Ribbon-helix-helix protein, copG family